MAAAVIALFLYVIWKLRFLEWQKKHYCAVFQTFWRAASEGKKDGSAPSDYIFRNTTFYREMLSFSILYQLYFFCNPNKKIGGYYQLFLAIQALFYLFLTINS